MDAARPCGTAGIHPQAGTAEQPPLSVAPVGDWILQAALKIVLEHLEDLISQEHAKWMELRQKTLRQVSQSAANRGPMAAQGLHEVH